MVIHGMRPRAAPLADADGCNSSASSTETSASADKPARSPERVPDMTLSTSCDIFADHSEETRVKQVLRDVAALRAWQSQAHPCNKIRDEAWVEMECASESSNEETECDFREEKEEDVHEDETWVRIANEGGRQHVRHASCGDGERDKRRYEPR